MGLTNFPDGINAGSGSTAGTLAIGGTAITATAANLNTVAGQTLKFAAGSVVTVAPFSTGTVATGLGTVLYAVSALQTAGTGASHSSAGTSPGGGTVIFNVYGTASAAATVAGTLHWFAAGS